MADRGAIAWRGRTTPACTSGIRDSHLVAIRRPGSPLHTYRAAFSEVAPAHRRDPCHPYPRSSPRCLDQTIRLKPSRDSNRIHTRAHKLVIFEIPKLPLIIFSVPPPIGMPYRQHGSQCYNAQQDGSTATAPACKRNAISVRLLGNAWYLCRASPDSVPRVLEGAW